MRDLSGRRVLVSGASGFVGANLSRALIALDAEVHAITRPSTDLWRIQSIFPSITIHHADLICGRDVQAVVDRVKPEYIFHLATLRSAATPAERMMTLQTNVLGLFNLLEAAETIDYRSFVCAGGSIEYGHKDKTLTEKDLLEPVTFYGATKAAAGILCRQHALACKRPIIILRLFSVYGYWEAHHRLIPSAILASMGKGDLSLTGPGLRRDLVFVDDVVDACIKASLAEIQAGEIINIGSGNQWTNEQVVSMIGELAGRSLRVRTGEFSARASDTTHWVADISLAQQRLHWQPRTMLREGLEKTMAWMRNHHQVYLKQRGEAL